MIPTATPTRSQAGTASVPPSRSTSPSTTPRAANGPNDEKRRARREQLRNFYGIKESTTPAAGSGAAGTGDVLNFDGPDFDATAYYQDMIAKSSLAELMKRAVALTAEVGDLQSSRHSLVYNHHPKLFSAGDAIQVLNTRTPQLIAIVTSLQDSFSSISQLADSVALPDPDPGAGLGLDGDPSDEVVRRAEKALARIRLMRTAEMSVDSIRAVFERIEPDLVQAEEGGNDRAGQLLQECRQIVAFPNERLGREHLAGAEGL